MSKTSPKGKFFRLWQKTNIKLRLEAQMQLQLLANCSLLSINDRKIQTLPHSLGVTIPPCSFSLYYFLFLQFRQILQVLIYTDITYGISPLSIASFVFGYPMNLNTITIANQHNIYLKIVIYLKFIVCLFVFGDCLFEF